MMSPVEDPWNVVPTVTGVGIASTERDNVQSQQVSPKES